MATTKIWSVKNRLDHVLEYVSNEDKTIDKLGSYVSRNEATENQKYMTCVNCSGNDPFTSMMNLKDVFHDTSNIIAYHAIQSFKPHETNADTVHEIGVETATRLYGDRYQFVVCTHLDKDHLHNHIVLNPISIVDGKRYHNSMRDIYQLREVSDEICKEYGLSIVEKPQGKGQSRSQYYSARSYIREIKKDIDAACIRAFAVKDFVQDMKLEGYSFEEVEGLDCVVHPNYDKPIPLLLLGQRYSLDCIEQRIEKEEVRYVPLKIIYKQKDADRIYGQYKSGMFKGFMKEVVKFQVLLGILPNYSATKIKLSKEMRKECRKLDLITNATTIMAKNDIDTLEKLESYVDLLDKQMNGLLAQRKHLYSRSYKEKDLIAKAKLSKEAKALTPDIKVLRSQIKSLDYIRKRSSKYREYNKQLEQKRNMDKQRA